MINERHLPIRLQNTDLLQKYYLWLCDLIIVDQSDRSYWLLVKELHRKEFRWSVPNDDNRAFEGRDLRCKFSDETGIEYYYDSFPEEASMLELIIALAYRCESIMADQGLADMRMVDWFWRLLGNVGLDKYTDDDFYRLYGDVEVDRILEKIICRTYHRSGQGGLFPMRTARKDQRRVELWYQMNTYLVENYYMDDRCV